MTGPSSSGQPTVVPVIGTITSSLMDAVRFRLEMHFLSCLMRSLPEKKWELKQYKRYRKRQRNAPPPLPPRKRQLSLPLPQSQPNNRLFRKAQKTLDQDKSPLFRLPAELRIMIWKEVMGYRVLHIDLPKKRLQHRLCSVCDPANYCAAPNGICWPLCVPRGMCSPISAPQRCGILALSKTCRRIYSETIDFAYSTNTFSFDELDCVRWFAASTLRLETITSLRLDWDTDRLDNPIMKSHYVTDWVLFCETLLRMSGLKELRIKLKGIFSTVRFSDTFLPLSPLTLLTGLDVFQVYVPIPLDDRWCLSSHSNLPFQLFDVQEWPQQ